MRSTLKVFIIPPGKSPEPGFGLELEARNEDGLRAAAHQALADRGLRVRTVSFTPTGLLAYAESMH